MAKEAELEDMIARVKTEIIKEMKVHQEVFKVADFSNQLKDLASAKGGAAWKITYDTAGERLEGIQGVTPFPWPTRRPVFPEQAWKITYDTSD